MEPELYKKRSLKHKRSLFERMRGFRSMDEHRPGEVIYIYIAVLSHTY
jgi:hypothetical protein